MKKVNKILSIISSLMIALYMCLYGMALYSFYLADKKPALLGYFKKEMNLVVELIGFAISFTLFIWVFTKFKNRIVKALGVTLFAIINQFAFGAIIEGVHLAADYLRANETGLMTLCNVFIVVINIIRILSIVAAVLAVVTLVAVVTKKLPISEEKEETKGDEVYRLLGKKVKGIRLALIIVNVAVVVLLMVTLVVGYGNEAMVNAQNKEISNTIYMAGTVPEVIDDVDYATELTIKGLKTFGIPLAAFLLCIVNYWLLKGKSIKVITSYFVYIILVKLGVALVYEPELTYYGSFNSYDANHLINNYLICVYVAIGIVMITMAWIKGVKAGVEECKEDEMKIKNT